MKNLITVLPLALFLAVSANAQDFKLSKNVKQTALSLRNVKVKQDSQSFDPNHILNSEVVLTLTAEYNSGWGWIQDAALAETYISGGSFETQETNSLAIVGIQESKTPYIELGDQPSTGGSSGVITVSLKLSPSTWSGSMKSHQWNYNVMSSDDAAPVQALSITLDKVSGWSVSIK